MARREKSSSVWSFKDYLYEACGETTLNHSFSEHKKHSCWKQETQKRSKQECPKCRKMLFKGSIYNHTNNGCQTQEDDR